MPGLIYISDYFFPLASFKAQELLSAEDLQLQKGVLLLAAHHSAGCDGFPLKHFCPVRFP